MAYLQSNIKRKIIISIPLGSSVSRRTPVSTAQHRATFSLVYPPPPVTCTKKFLSVCLMYDTNELKVLVKLNTHQ